MTWVPVLLVAIVLILVIVAIVKAIRLPARVRADWKTCPDCASRVPVQARVCRGCGYQFAE